MLKTSHKTALLAAVLYFSCVGLAVAIDLGIFKVTNMYNTPAMTAVFAAYFYMVTLKQAKQFGIVTFIGLVMSFFFLFSGHFVFAALPNLICGLLADFVAKQGNYNNPNLNLVSYAIFSLGNLAPLVTMWMAPKAYTAQLLAEGKNQAYADSVMVPFTSHHFLILFGGVTLAAFISGYLAQKIVFKKA